MAAQTWRGAPHDQQRNTDTTGGEVTVTTEELTTLPVVVDLATAAEALGIGLSTAYELVRTDQWPTPILRLGRLIKIPTAALRCLLLTADTPATPGAVVVTGTHAAVREVP